MANNKTPIGVVPVSDEEFNAWLDKEFPAKEKASNKTPIGVVPVSDEEFNAWLDKEFPPQKKAPPKENELPIWKRIGSSLLSGAYGVSAQSGGAISLATDIISKPPLGLPEIDVIPSLLEKLGYDEKAKKFRNVSSNEAFKNNDLNPLKYLEQATQSAEYLQEKYSQANKYEKTAINLAKEGRYSEAAGNLAYTLLEQIPQYSAQVLMTILSGSVGGATFMGSLAAGGKYEMLKEQNGLSEDAQVANALMTGLSEVLWEKAGTEKILGKILNTKEGKRSFKEAIKQYFVNMGAEGSEESLTQVTDNIIDIVSGVKDKDGNRPNILDGVADAGLVGAMFGGAISLSGKGIRGLRDFSEKNKTSLNTDEIEGKKRRIEGTIPAIDDNIPPVSQEELNALPLAESVMPASGEEAKRIPAPIDNKPGHSVTIEGKTISATGSDEAKIVALLPNGGFAEFHASFSDGKVSSVNLIGGDLVNEGDEIALDKFSEDISKAANFADRGFFRISAAGIGKESKRTTIPEGLVSTLDVDKKAKRDLKLKTEAEKEAKKIAAAEAKKTSLIQSVSIPTEEEKINAIREEKKKEGARFTYDIEASSNKEEAISKIINANNGDKIKEVIGKADTGKLAAMSDINTAIDGVTSSIDAIVNSVKENKTIEKAKEKTVDSLYGYLEELFVLQEKKRDIISKRVERKIEKSIVSENKTLEAPNKDVATTVIPTTSKEKIDIKKHIYTGEEGAADRMEGIVGYFLTEDLEKRLEEPELFLNEYNIYRELINETIAEIKKVKVKTNKNLQNKKDYIKMLASISRDLKAKKNVIIEEVNAEKKKSLAAEEKKNNIKKIAAMPEVPTAEERILKKLSERSNITDIFIDEEINKKSNTVKRVSEIVNKFTGKDPIFVKANTKFYGVNYQGRIIISSDALTSDRLATFVTVHEAVHQIEKTSPDLYSQIKDAYTEQIKDAKNDVEVYENIANFIAERATTKAFWKNLAKKAPAAAKELIVRIIETLKKASGIFTLDKVAQSKLLNDAEKLEKIAIDVIGEYLNKAEINAVKAESADTPKFLLKNSSTQQNALLEKYKSLSGIKMATTSQFERYYRLKALAKRTNPDYLFPEKPIDISMENMAKLIDTIENDLSFLSNEELMPKRGKFKAKLLELTNVATKALINKNSPIDKLVNCVINKYGDVVQDYENPALRLALMNGRVQNITEGFINWTTDYLKRLSNAEIPTDIFEAFMIINHAEDRNTAIEFNKLKKGLEAKLSKTKQKPTEIELARLKNKARMNLDANHSGLSTRNAQELKKEFITAHPKIQSFMDEWIKNVSNKELDYKSDIYGKELLNILGDKYGKTYIPLKSEDLVKKISNEIKARGVSVLSKGIIAAGGRQTLADSPMAFGVQKLINSIEAYEKNNSAKTVYYFFNKFPMPNLVEILRVGSPNLETMLADNEDARVNESIIGHRLAGENELSFFERGQQIIIRFNPDNPVSMQLAEALNNTSSKTAETLYRWMFDNKIGEAYKTFHDYMKKINTTYNPEFPFRNVIKDFGSAAYNILTLGVIKESEVPKFLKNESVLLYELIKGISGETDPEIMKYYNLYKRIGGATGFTISKDINDIKEKIIKELSGNKAPNYKKTLMILGKYLTGISEATEYATRLNVFKTAMEKGFSAQRAAYIAKTASVNFDAKGNWGRVLNTIYAFFNASVQSLYRFAQTTTNNNMPIYTGQSKSKLNWRGVLLPTIVIPAFAIILDTINRIVAERDDKEKENYRKINKYTKDNNIIIPIIGTGKHVKIPIAYVLNIPWTLGNVIGDYARGEITADDAFVRMLNSIGNSVNPLNSSLSAFSTYLPTAVRPFAQLAENTDFSGNPIYKEQVFGAKKPESEMYFKSVSEENKAFAKWLNRIAGGNEFVSSSKLTDINPEWLDYVMMQYSGGIGRISVKTKEAVKRLVSDEEILDIADVPLVSMFIGKPSENFDLTIAYHYMEESNRKILSEKETNLFLTSLKNAVNSETIPRKQYTTMRENFIRSQRKLKRSKKNE